MEGDLTLKGKTLPFGFDFFFEELSPQSASVNASFVLKRSDFAIGDKDPKKANDVKDDVIVKFVLNAVR